MIGYAAQQRNQTTTVDLAGPQATSPYAPCLASCYSQPAAISTSSSAESIHSCSTHTPPRNIVGHHQMDQPTTASQHLPPKSAPSPVPAAPESTSYRDRLNSSKHCSTRLALPLPSLLLPHHANSSPPLGGAHCNSSNDASAPCLLTGILLLPALLQCTVLPGCHTGSSSRSRCGEFPAGRNRTTHQQHHAQPARHNSIIAFCCCFHMSALVDSSQLSYNTVQCSTAVSQSTLCPQLMTCCIHHWLPPVCSACRQGCRRGVR
jgi:hypothetical protein